MKATHTVADRKATMRTFGVSWGEVKPGSYGCAEIQVDQVSEAIVRFKTSRNFALEGLAFVKKVSLDCLNMVRYFLTEDKAMGDKG